MIDDLRIYIEINHTIKPVDYPFFKSSIQLETSE